jgi:hypothetical protein
MNGMDLIVIGLITVVLLGLHAGAGSLFLVMASAAAAELASRNLPFRDLDRLAVRVLQPTDHRHRQGDGADIKRSIAHKVVSTQLK